MGFDDDVCEMYCFNRDKVERIKNNLVDVSGLAGLFKVLGDETRTKILYLLSQDELCVCDVATILDTTVSNVSHHLRLLKAARLVKYRKEGKNVFYSLDDEHVVNLFREGFDHVKHNRRINNLSCSNNRLNPPVSEQEVLKMGSYAGPHPADPKPGKADIVIKVPDMSCNHCKTAIEKAVKNLGGVHDVNINLESKEVKVSYDSTDVREEDIKQAIEDAGYTAR